MSNSYVSCIMHVIFSTKQRRELITSVLEERLWPYLGGIARTHEMTMLARGGIADHVHLLLALPATLAVAKAVQLVKGGSSKWVHDTYPDLHQFAWQEGYGAFCVSPNGVAAVKEYINAQREHHRTHTFQEEFRAFLDRYGIAYDERYLWD